MPMRDERDYADYRKHRMKMLQAYVLTAKLKSPAATTFVGLAFGNPKKGYAGQSEDFMVPSRDAWTQEELDNLELMRVELGLWREDRGETCRYRQDEFPNASQMNPMQRIRLDEDRPAHSRQNEARKAAKHKQSMKRQSQRQNRRRK